MPSTADPWVEPALQAASVLATLLLAFLAYRAGRAALRTAEAAEAQTEAQVRPLLLDVPESPGSPASSARETVRFKDGLEALVPFGRIHAYAGSGTGYLSVPLRNVGRGIADLRGVELLVGSGGLAGSTRRPNVPPGETTRIEFVVPRDTERSYSDFFVIAAEQFYSEDYDQPAGRATPEVPWDTEGIVACQVSYTDLAGRQPTKTRIEVRRAATDGSWSFHRVQHFVGEEALPLFEVDPMNLRC